MKKTFGTRAMVRLALLSACAAMPVIASAQATPSPAVPSVPADAQNPQADGGAIHDIVVTAERRSTSLQKAPLAVSVIDAGEIAREGKTSYEDVLRDVPSLQIQSVPGNGPPTPTIAIRGVGTDGQSKPPATAIYVDGVQIDRQGAQFYDLARVEVLRGPQGTLYGGTATAGAVNIVTNDPKLDRVEGSALIDVGNYGNLHTSGMANAPISDDLALRVAFNQVRRSNYAGGGDTASSEINARAKLLYKPNNNFSALLGGEYYNYSGLPLGDGRYAQNSAGQLVGNYVPSFGYGHTDVYKIYANLNWDLGIANLTYLPAFQRLTSDLSFANEYIGSQELQTPYEAVHSQELRLSNRPGDKIIWVLGLYYRGVRRDAFVNVGYAAELPNIDNRFVQVQDITHTDQFGAFAQTTVPITDHFRVTGGLRYSRDHVANDENFGFLGGTPVSDGLPYIGVESYLYDHTFQSVDYLGRAEFDLSPRNLLYAVASSGYRPGGAAPNGVNYGVERVRAYEVGSKNRLLDNRLQLNVSAYLNDYPNFQNQATLFGPNNLQISTIVGVPAKLYGVELEAIASLSRNDKLNLSGSWEHATYTGNGTVTDLSGDTASLATDGGVLPHAPKWILTAGYDHTFELNNGGKILASVSSNYRSRQFLSFNGCNYDAQACTGGFTQAVLSQDGFTLLDGSLTFTSPNDRFTLSVYGRNITNKHYKLGLDGTYVWLGAPATYGVSAGYKF